MEEKKEMDLFAGVWHEGDEDLDTMPPLKDGASETELLDYMVLVLSRMMTGAAAFKGGYMLNKLLKEHSRLTHDVDLSVAKRGDYEGVKRILQRIGDKFREAGYIASYQIKEEIAERMSGGIDLYDESGRKVLGVDVGLHNISYGIRHYDIGFVEVDGFSVERMLADKLIAITTRKRFRRTKDLYDFYVITNYFDVKMEELKEYVALRGGAQWENIPFNEDVITQYSYAWEKLSLINAMTGEDLEKPEFDVVLGRYYDFALPIKNGAADRWVWSHEGATFYIR